MSQVTQRSPTLSPYRRSTSRARPTAITWLFGGVLAAGLGLGALAVLVLLLWIISPYPDSGADGALHVAADLWLLAHGSTLLRTETHSGMPAPVALTPLLLAALPGWLLYRSCLQALMERTAGQPDGVPGGPAPAGWVAVGYLLTGATTVLFVAGGPFPADVPSAAVRLPLFVVCVAAVAAWAGREGTEPKESGADTGNAPDPPLLPLPPQVREALALSRRLRPLRTAAIATAVLCGGGFLLTLGSVLWHLDAVRASFPQLTGDWSGQWAVGLLAIALLPNAAVWAAAYGLGPGFTLGAGSVVAPLTTDGDSRLPPFPLLAALPSEDSGWSWAGLVGVLAACAVPLAAAATVSWYVARAAVPVPGCRQGAAGRWSTVYGTGLVACGCGVAVALLASCASGALGTRSMAFFGPDWWLTGLAALVWTAAAGAPGALALRAWRLRERGPDDDWHATAARQARWTALKTASGGLMPDFEPRRD
ncbi:MAG: cell division protein PerM [Streptomyces sp.]|uniref:cell division protein PerM n=1 Tax=Streptomyces sp. TaxID=1931 RepID=UPI003D6ABC1A